MAAAIFKDILNVVFIKICEMRGTAACSNSTEMPSRVATRTGLSTQVCTIRSEASSVDGNGMLS